MARKRPTSVTVMAILNIIFGSLGLICYTCSGLSTLVNVVNANQGGIGAANDPSGELLRAMQKEIPGFMPIQVVSTVGGLGLSILLIISGIGLLNMRNWARTAAIVYAVIDIILHIASLVFQLAFVNPVMNREMNRLMQAQFRQANAPVQDMSILLTIMNVGTVVATLLFVIYDVVLLIVMLLPRVSAAFRGQLATADYASDYMDEEDDDLGRERRRLDERNE